MMSNERNIIKYSKQNDAKSEMQELRDGIYVTWLSLFPHAISLVERDWINERGESIQERIAQTSVAAKLFAERNSLARFCAIFVGEATDCRHTLSPFRIRIVHII